MNNPKISVILPIYNVEDYVEECLDSLLNQTFKDFEVIMIDDESTDDTRYILEKYALDYENFHVYHKKNEGQSIGRNYGINLAKGDYIHFMDPDDYLCEDSYEKMYKLAIKEDFDIVIGNALRYDEYSSWKEVLVGTVYDNIEEEVTSTHITKHTKLIYDTGPWNKLFKREFLLKNDLKFPNERIFYQDVLFTFKTHYLAQSIGVVHDIVYYWRYRRNNTSATQKKSDIKNFNDRIRILTLINEFMDEHNVEEKLRNDEYEKWLNHDLMLFVKRINNYDEKYYNHIIENMNYLLKIIPKEVKERLNSYKQIIYKICENNDLESLVLYDEIRKDLEECKIPNNLKEEYYKYIDFERDLKNENHIAELEYVKIKDNNLIIDFTSNIKYLTNYKDDDLSGKLVDTKGKEHSIECINLNKNLNQITIPIDLIKENNHSQIKIYNKKIGGLLKIHGRKALIKDDLEVNLGHGENRYIYLDIRKQNENEIEIEDIFLEDDEFILIGKSKEKIENLFVENMIDFKKMNYPIKSIEKIEYNKEKEIVDDKQTEEQIEANDTETTVEIKEGVSEQELIIEKEELNYKFICNISYKDLVNSPIKRWEVKTENFKTISLKEKYEIHDNKNEIKIINDRNKILILINHYNKLMKINKLKDRIKKLEERNRKQKERNERLKERNKRLKERNRKQKERIEEFKSRKAVRIADKLKI